MQKPSIKFPSISLKSLSLKIWPKEKSSICLKILKKSVNQLKNKRKFKSLWLKSTNSGNQESSILLVGVKGKMPFWPVCVYKKLPKDSKKIKWHWVQLMPKDMSFHSRRELNNLSEDSQTLHKHWISGSRFKSSGQVWSQFSQEVISLSKCHSKPSSSQVLTRLGLSVCKSHSKPKRFFNVVNLTCWKTTCQICKRNLKNAKSYWKPIFKVKENCSQDFISSPIQHCLRFYRKVHNQLQFKKTSKNFSTPLQRSNSVSQTRRVQTKRPF